MAKLDESGRLIYDKITDPSVVQANYLASNQDEYIVDDLIKIYTGLMPWNYGTPPCSHTEIGFWVDGELWFFSSTSRKELGSSGTNGTRWVKGSELLRNPDRWLLQEKTICPRLVKSYKDQGIKDLPKTPLFLIDRKIRRANSLIGLTYDFKGVFTDFVIPYRIFKEQDLTPELIWKIKKIYCSKAVHVVDTGRLGVYSPKRQFTWAKNKGYVIVPDTKKFLVDRGVIK